MAHYLTIEFSKAQAQLSPEQRAHEATELQKYLRQQGISPVGVERLNLFCYAEFYVRTDPQRELTRLGVVSCVGSVPIQQAVYVCTGHVFSFPDFTEGQKNAIELLGFKTDVEEGFKPSLSISD